MDLIPLIPTAVIYQFQTVTTPSLAFGSAQFKMKLDLDLILFT